METRGGEDNGRPTLFIFLYPEMNKVIEAKVTS